MSAQKTISKITSIKKHIFVLFNNKKASRENILMLKIIFFGNKDCKCDPTLFSPSVDLTPTPFKCFLNKLTPHNFLLSRKMNPNKTSLV